MNYEIFNPDNYIFNLYTLGPLVVGVLVFLMGIAVLIKERTSHASFAFLFFSLSVSTWFLAYAAMTATPVESVALSLAKIKNFGVTFVPATTFIFMLTVIRRFRQFRNYAGVSLVLSALFYVAVPGTNLFIRDLYHYPWGYYSKYTYYQLGFVFYLVIMISLCMVSFAIEYKRSESKIHRKRLKTFLVAFSIGSLAAIDFLAAYGIPVYPFGYLPILVFLILTARTVLRYRLLDITPSFAASKIVHTISDVLIVFDHEGIIRFTNNAATKLFQTNLMGRPIAVLDGGLLTPVQLRSVIQGHNLRGIEVSYRNHSGKVMVLSIATASIFDPSGKSVAVVCLARDISEYKRLEQEREEQAKQLEKTNQELLDREKVMMSLLEDLQTSQQSVSQLAAIVQSSDEAIISKTLDGIIQSWNHGAELAYGYTAKEVVGRSISVIIPADRIHELHEIMNKIKEGKRVHQFETRHISKQGKLIDVSITVSPMRDHAGKIVGASAITRDISEQKRIQEQLQISEEHNRLVIETAYDAFIGMDSKGLITDWNEQAKIIFGWSKAEALGKSLAETIIPERFREAHRIGLARFLITGVGPVLNKRIEMVGVRKNEKEFPCELTIWPVKTKDSYYFNSFVHDITERKKAEEELLQKTAELAKITAEREQAELFAFAASHDLQEPLAKIIAFGDLLKIQAQEKLNDKNKDYIYRMQSAATRMSQLIEALLKFSRVTTKTESFEQVNLEKVIKEVLSDLEFKISESKAKIEMKNLPVIQGDWLQLYEVFQNLITNSIKFRKKDTLHEIKISSKPAGNGYIEVSVQDNGIGFEQKYADRLFKPFERLHSRHEYEGSGMGLAICQKIMLRHGGSIRAQGQLGAGATFLLRLPVNN